MWGTPVFRVSTELEFIDCHGQRKRPSLSYIKGWTVDGRAARRWPGAGDEGCVSIVHYGDQLAHPCKPHGPLASAMQYSSVSARPGEHSDRSRQARNPSWRTPRAPACVCSTGRHANLTITPPPAAEPSPR
jgi:hypothetical protein